MKKRITLAILLVFGFHAAYSCTTAIISGEHTPDGRPLLWKHRDTDYLDNKIAYFSKGNLWAVALVDSEDEKRENIWIGHNSAGFAIMNAASYNMNHYDSTDYSDQEGILMKEALLSCQTVDDFEQFLREHEKPKGVEANFGVIDARGNGAYFETGNYSYTKYSVHDKKIAPHGYLIRTNYSFSGRPSDGAGYIRYETASNLFYRASGRNNLSLSFILNQAGKSLKNSMTGTDNADLASIGEEKDNFYYIDDCINRYYSSSTVVVQGVKNKEEPALTTMWSKVGYPLSSVVVPIWGSEQGHLPSVVTAPKGENAPLCNKALEVKKIMFPMKRGHGEYYLNTTRAINADHTGVTQKLAPVNRKIFQKSRDKLQAWRKEGAINPDQMTSLYQWIDNTIHKAYEKLFDI